MVASVGVRHRQHYLTPLRQELANLPVEPFFLTFRRLFKTEEKANNL